MPFTQQNRKQTKAKSMQSYSGIRDELKYHKMLRSVSLHGIMQSLYGMNDKKVLTNVVYLHISFLKWTRVYTIKQPAMLIKSLISGLPLQSCTNPNPHSQTAKFCNGHYNSVFPSVHIPSKWFLLLRFPK